MSEGKLLLLDELRKKRKEERKGTKYDFKIGEREFTLHVAGCPSGIHLVYCIDLPVQIEAPDFVKQLLEEQGIIKKMGQKPVRRVDIHRRSWLFWLPFRWHVERAIVRMRKDIEESCAALDRYDELAREIENS